MCGLILLAAATGLGSCNGDPTESIREEGQKVLATPSSVFVDQGTTEFVIVQLVDGQGNQLAADFEPQNIGAGITVVEDPTYLATSDGSRIPTSTRFVVGGVDATSTTFVATAAGVSATIPVRVVPSGAGIPLATVSSTGPNPTDPTVLTVPVPFLFPADATIGFPVGAEIVAAIVTDRSSDGTSLTVLPPPGATGTGEATIIVDYLPTVDIPTTTDVPVTVGVTAAVQAGTNDPATAPTITLVSGVQGGVIDGNGGYAAATCGGNSGIPCQLYKFTLNAESEVDAEMRWSNEADLGLYIMSEDGTTDTDQACDGHGRGPGTASQPEHCVLALPAGTYLAGAVNFGPFYPENDPNPDWVSLRLVVSEP
jgi:hypothetical protein